MSNSLQPHGLQHVRPPCLSPTPRVYTNSSPLSRWCHPTISSSVAPFSSCLQPFPASGSFPSWTSPKETVTTVYCYASRLVWGIICFITIYNYYNFSTRPGTGPLLQIEGPAQPITANVHQDSWWAGLFGNPFQVRAHLKRVDVHLEGLAQSHDHVGSLSCRMLPS